MYWIDLLEGHACKAVPARGASDRSVASLAPSADRPSYSCFEDGRLHAQLSCTQRKAACGEQWRRARDKITLPMFIASQVPRKMVVYSWKAASSTI